MFDLMKFTVSKYVDDVLDGNLYMNSLGYFWEKGFEGQRDFSEGTEYYASPNSLELGELTPYTLGNIGMLNDNYKYVNVFCMYRLDRYLNQVHRINKRILDFGEYAIHIHNADAFIARVIKAAALHNDMKCCCGDVHYYQYFDENNVKYNYGCFYKTMVFDYQREWRIALLNNYTSLLAKAHTNIGEPFIEPFVLRIGSIRDIATVVASTEIITHQRKFFTGSSIVDKIERKSELTPQLADEWFFKGFAFPRNALDGAYWGNCDNSSFNGAVIGLAPSAYKMHFTIG